MTEANDRLDRVERNLEQFSDRLTTYQEIANATAASNQAQIEAINQTLLNATAIVDRMSQQADRRLQQHDLELDDHDERVENIERLLTKHDEDIDSIKDIQRDIKAILQMMTARFAGEPPSGNN